MISIGVGSWRRFTVTVVGTNFTVRDSGTGATVTTALAVAGTQTLNLFTLSGGEIILAVKAKHSLAFTGGAVTMTTVEVGVAAGTDRYLSRFNIFQAAADTAAARMLQKGGTLRSIASPLPDTTAATPAVPVATVTTGNLAGDRVLACTAVYSIAAGFTEAGSTGAGGGAGVLGLTELVPGRHFTPVAAAVDAVGITNPVTAGNTETDLTPATGCFIFEDGGGMESDAAAGTAVNAIFRTTVGNVSALTAGALELFMLIDRAPQAAIGVG